jgi:hypothetical protein
MPGGIFMMPKNLVSPAGIGMVVGMSRKLEEIKT